MLVRRFHGPSLPDKLLRCKSLMGLGVALLGLVVETLSGVRLAVFVGVSGSPELCNFLKG